MAQAELKQVEETKPMLKLDLGCGKNKREGFLGVDSIAFEPVDRLADLGAERWQLASYALDDDGSVMRGDGIELEDGSVDEAHCSHFIEHLTWPQRVNFFNELYRVMKVGAQCQLILPHWASARYYGDPTHKEPMSEFAFYYLDREWRKSNAPHVGYTCDFAVTWGYSLHQSLTSRNQEYQQHAIQFWKEAAQDIIATLTKR